MDQKYIQTAIDYKKNIAGKFVLVGGEQKDIEPLVMANGGTPYRAFLEGRVDGDKYALILHLTNMELKSIEPKSE